MVKPRKKPRKRSSPSSRRPVRFSLPSPELLAQLDEVERLTKREKWDEAYDLISQLHAAHPKRDRKSVV